MRQDTSSCPVLAAPPWRFDPLHPRTRGVFGPIQSFMHETFGWRPLVAVFSRRVPMLCTGSDLAGFGLAGSVPAIGATYQ